MKNIFFFLFTLFFLLSYSQDTYKEKIQALKEMSYEDLSESSFQLKKDTLLAKLYANAFLLKAKVEEDTVRIAEGYFLLAYASYKEADKILLYADSTILVTKNKINEIHPVRAYILKANSYGVEGRYKKAFLELEEANKAVNISGNISQKYQIKYLLARLKTDVGDYESSLEILKDVISYNESLSKNNNDERGYILSSWGYANNLNLLKRPDSIELIIKKIIPRSLKTFDSLMYDRLLLSSAISNYQKKDYKSSLDSILKLSRIYDKKGSNIGTNVLKHLYQGKIYLKQQKYKLAVNNFKKVDSISFNKKYFHPSIRENYEFLINYYKETKNIKNQLFYIDKLLIVDSIIDKNYAYLTRNFNKKYATPNLILEKQKIIESLEKNDTTKKRILTILLIFSVLLIILLVRNNKKRRLYKQRIEELTTRKPNDNHKNKIDDDTTQRILDDLDKIEESQLFLDKNFNLSFLAKKLETNTSYLSKTINEYKQKTFKQYLIELRIKVLLENLDENPIMRKHSIEALAESIGYNNASSFTRIFKSYLGESPSAFLNKKYPERNK